MSQTRPWRFRMCTGVAIVAFGYAFLMANVFPRVKFARFVMPRMCYDMPNDVYEHGWPVPYMSREHVADGDMGGVFYPPWPFGRRWPFTHGFGNPPLIQFRAGSLILDAVVAVSLLSLSVYSVHTRCASSKFRMRFSLRQFLASTAIACGCLGLVRTFDDFDLMELALVLFFVLLPTCLLMASVILAVLTFGCLIRHAIVNRRTTT